MRLLVLVAFAYQLLILAPQQAAAKSLAGYSRSFYYIQPNGQVYGFGDNSFGGLGIGTVVNASFPTQMLGVVSATDVASGDTHACIVDQGAVKCVGNGADGRLGKGFAAYSTSLIQAIDSGVSQVYAGFAHSCATLTKGGAKCWGLNSYGALGDNTKTARYTPVDVHVYYESIAQMGLGNAHTCLLTVAGTVACTGFNNGGPVGAGASEMYLQMTPVVVPDTNTRFVALSCGGLHTCAVSEHGEVFCWGSNFSGQLGVAGLSYSYVSAPLCSKH